MGLAIISELVQHAGQWPLIIKVVVWISFACALSILLLLSYTVILRVWLDWQHRYSGRFKRKWQPILFEWLTGHEQKLLPLHGRDRYLMLDLWHDIRRQIDGTGATGLNRFAEELQLDHIAANLLQYRKLNAHKRNVWRQILAIRVARLINTPVAVEALLTAAQSSNFLINIEATCALVELDHPRAEYSVFTTLMQFSRWVPYIANKVSKSGGSEFLHLILKRINLLNIEQARNLISLLEYTNDKNLVPQLVELLYKIDDPEVQAIILRTLGRLGDASIKKHLIPFLKSEFAWLRLHAIVAIGKIGDKADLVRLTPLLSDRDWWVRYRTAQTCLILLGNNHDALQGMMAGLTDTYAREALAQARAEQSL